MAKDQTATPGTHFVGPIRIEEVPGETEFTALPDALTDNTGGTADDTVVDVSTAVTAAGANPSALKSDVDSRLSDINDNFAELTAQINAILERIQ